MELDFAKHVQVRAQYTHRDFQAEDTRLTRLWKVRTKIFQTGGRRSWNRKLEVNGNNIKWLSYLSLRK